MRTTLTPDDELARTLRRITRQTNRAFKEVVNTTLRRGLTQGEKPATSWPPLTIKTVTSVATCQTAPCPVVVIREP